MRINNFCLIFSIIFLGFILTEQASSQETPSAGAAIQQNPAAQENKQVPAEAAAPQTEDNEDILPKDFFKSGEERHPSGEGSFTTHVRIQALNKFTANTSLLEIEKGSQIQFGSLTMELQSCWRSPPEDRPESAALLRISEQKTPEDKKQIFFGWMFASSPSLNALEHSVYDIAVVECY